MKRNKTLLVLLPIVLTLVFGGIPVFAATCGGTDTSILECEKVVVERYGIFCC